MAKETVTYKGKIYTLNTQAELSNRVFPGSWFDAQEGDNYIAEWAADGEDENGNLVKVSWWFDEIKGNEPEDASDYDWSDGNIHKVIYQ